MFAFIHPCSGQSGSGFVPHSPAPLALALPPAAPLAAAAVLLVPGAAAVGPADADADADADAGAVSEGAAEAVAVADSLATGSLDAAGGGTEEAEGLAPLSVPSDFVQATKSAAIERRTGKERMGGELTRNRI
jgi:hypothetical protein